MAQETYSDRGEITFSEYFELLEQIDREWRALLTKVIPPATMAGQPTEGIGK